MQSNKKKIIILAVLIPITIFLTYYTACAHYVGAHVIEDDGNLYWPTLSEYTFLPWPEVPTAGFLMLAQLSQADVQYYNYVIRSGVLIALTFLFWIADFWLAWRIVRNYFKSKQLTQ